MRHISETSASRPRETGPQEVLMTEASWAGLLSLRLSLWPTTSPLDEEAALVWLEHLEDLDPAHVSRAMHAWARDQKWPPALAELRDAALAERAKARTQPAGPPTEPTISPEKREVWGEIIRERITGGLKPPPGEVFEPWIESVADARMVERYGVREVARSEWGCARRRDKAEAA